MITYLAIEKGQNVDEDYTDFNVTGLKKEGHTYLFIYFDDQIPEVRRYLSRTASDPELNFNWYDAVGLSKKLPFDDERP